MNTTTLASALSSLQSIAELTPEYEGNDVPGAVRPNVEALLADHPGLARHGDYIEFLLSTGGAHFDNEMFSFGIYGFGGYVVPSIEERQCVDEGRLFLFGEVLYYAGNREIFLFFDLQGNDESVLFSSEEGREHRILAASFRELLQNLSEGADRKMK